MTSLYVLLAVDILTNLMWALLWVRMSHDTQAKWDAERQTLLDRIQAGSFSEYQHLTGTRKPRTHNPMRKAVSHSDDIPDEPEGVNADA